jgi:hypothetical protein
MKSIDFAKLYNSFDSPIAALDCGDKCSPYNERLVPFCCDTRHMIPSAYQYEWKYLTSNTDLWHLWRGASEDEELRLRDQTPSGQVLIECQGHLRCQRNFRSITCRAFPFFPYIDSSGAFLGLSYYWEFEDRCWVISNLNIVSRGYLKQFIDAFDALLCAHPDERENFRFHSDLMRKEYRRGRRAIILLNKNGFYYKISPHNERGRRITPQQLPKFGNYKLIADLPFPDEL